MKRNLHASLTFMFLYLFCNNATAQLKPYEQIGSKILQNHQSASNPVYQVPCGSSNPVCYLNMAFATGLSVVQPLSYFITESPASYYINYSLQPFVCERGKSMKVVLSANKTGATTTEAYAYAFADWNRDGIFETNIGKYTIPGLNTEGISGVNIPVDIPASASLGKTRLRIYLTNKVLTTVNSTDQVSGGYIYDFVCFINENTGANNGVAVHVSSANVNWGSAIIQTSSPTSNNRYASGSAVTVRAVKASQVKFTGWSNGTQIVSTQEEYTFTATEPTYLVALFEKTTVSLEAPQTSTTENPVWYQIKNAQTDARLNRFLAYEPIIPAGYITQLRIEKPEDFTDRFLWRLEAGTNNQVKLVNKGTNKRIIADGTLSTALNVDDTGSEFQVVSSGAANGSYSIKWNSMNDKLLNGGLSYNVVLFNGGVGTGSGWYFYRVPPDLLSSNIKIENTYKIYLSNGFLHAENVRPGSNVIVYNLLGSEMMRVNVQSNHLSEPFEAKGVFVAVVRTAEAKYSTVKIMQ